MLNMLNESSYVLPFNSKVKINESKVSTNVGVGEVTVLSLKIVLPKVAFKASGVGTLELVSMSFDASAAVTLKYMFMS